MLEGLCTSSGVGDLTLYTWLAIEFWTPSAICPPSGPSFAIVSKLVAAFHKRRVESEPLPALLAGQPTPCKVGMHLMARPGFQSKQT